jgi:hypothetical protein
MFVGSDGRLGQFQVRFKRTTADAVPFNPRAVVLIGDLERQGIEDDKRRSFELFRNQLAGVEVVTFDELAAKARGLLELFRADPGEEVPLPE